MNRLTILLAVVACLAFAAPASAGQGLQAAMPVATTAQDEPTETTPGQDDPEEEEIGEDFEPPAEQEEEPEQEEAAPTPAPAPAPTAAPAPAELPRTGTDPRLLLVAASVFLAGLALRRAARAS